MSETSNIRQAGSADSNIRQAGSADSNIHRAEVKEGLRTGNLNRPPPRYGPAVKEPQKTIEINRRVAASGTSTPAMGAFYGFYTVPDGDDVGDIYLQGGTIGGEAVATLDLKLYDASEDDWEGTMGQHLWVPVAGNGVVEDLVLLPGFTVSTVAPAQIGTPDPDDHPTAANDEGICNISLGVFTDAGFMPAAIGNRAITFCPGGSFIVTP